MSDLQTERPNAVEDLALQVAAAITQLRATAVADTGNLDEPLRRTKP